MTATRPPEAGGEPLGVFGPPLTSSQNALVKRAASLHQRKFRDREGAFLAEGADVVAAALAAGWRPQAVFVREEAADELAERLGLTAEGADSPGGPAPAVFAVTDRVAARISTFETPADVVAVLPLPERRPVSSLPGPASSPKTAALRRAAGKEASLAAGAPAPAGEAAAPAGEAAAPAGEAAAPAGEAPGSLLVVYVDGVQDPGNVGTLLRAAVAFGAAAVVTSATSADLFGTKTVRASMGALFAAPVFPAVALADVVEQLPAPTVYGLVAHGGTPIGAAELRRPAVLVVGAERAGISRASLPYVAELLTIPLSPAVPGAVESLNAAVAGAIALYEFSRRPSGAPEDPSRRARAAQEG